MEIKAFHSHGNASTCRAPNSSRMLNQRAMSRSIRHCKKHSGGSTRIRRQAMSMLKPRISFAHSRKLDLTSKSSPDCSYRMWSANIR
ncbi:hypothetical protein X961_2630 [Burkholderia pseudomallei MSHR5613]|nr:hypothetical protein X941_2829 [Burkholderia pseudomallei MSHR5569]KGS50422.1 hypothetical protein X961_2630 [Burkholderia pseudomallei MSHR5613]